MASKKPLILRSARHSTRWRARLEDAQSRSARVANRVSGRRGKAMRVFTTVPQENLRLVPQAARAAEAERYDGIISMENKHDPFLALAVAGAATERIESHTGVAISFARTPMAVAQIGWDL